MVGVGVDRLFKAKLYDRIGTRGWVDMDGVVVRKGV